MLETTPHSYSINLSVDDIFDIPTKEFLIEKAPKILNMPTDLYFELLESEGIENYPEVSTFISRSKAVRMPYCYR
jgi:c-di-GMP phosphodiesterase